MSDRLATHMLVSAVSRKVEEAGGFATIVHKGDPVSGTVLVQCLLKGKETGLFERVSDYSGGYLMIPCGPAAGADSYATADYVARRRQADPDLWLIELDVADAERLAVETLC